MAVLKSLAAALLLVHLVSAWNYGGGWHDKIKSQIIVKHVPKHVPVYKPVPIPKPYPVAKPVGYLKPFAIAKPFKVPHVIPVIKHFQKPFPVIKGVPFHFPIPLPKLVKLPFQIKLPKPYLVHVPKPYAVAKKYPVAVPVHVPKPYIVPVIRPVPVGVPQKVPYYVPVVKEIPEYIKKPVPVFIEEQQMNHKGSPFPSGISGGLSKGTPFPSGFSGGLNKGTPFPSGFSGGLSKGTPFPSSELSKGSPYPESINSGSKGSPFGSSGKGSGSEYHSKSTNVHATSAANFLATHAGKLQSQSEGGYGSLLGSYSHSQSNSQLQGEENPIYQDYGGHFQQSYGGHGEYGIGGGAHGLSDGNGAYGTRGLSTEGGHDPPGVYGRETGTNKVNEDESAAEEHGSYDSVRAHGGHLSSSKDEFGKRPIETKEIYPPKDAPQAYIGVSVTSYNDHSGRGGGYDDGLQNTNYHQESGYQQNVGEHSQDSSHGYGGDSENPQYHLQNSESSYAHQGNSGSYAQLPQLAVYQIQNGGATATNYPGPVIQMYGNNHQQGYQPQGEGEYATNHLGSGNYELQAYPHQNEQSNYGSYEQQPNAYVYHNQDRYQGDSYQENQGYSGHQGQNVGNYANQEGAYGNREGYNNPTTYPIQESYDNQAKSEVYHNEASYQVNHDAGGYNGQEAAPGLQQYGLQAAYAVQPNEVPSHQGTGTAYVRAYDNRGGSQIAYSVPNDEQYQTQDSQQQESYAAYSTKANAAVSATQQASSQEVAAAGRSTNDQIVGSSGIYSAQEGGDVKGSWQGVPV